MTWGRLTLTLAAALLALTEVRAAPLDVDGCARLKSEQATLEQAGVRGNMAKGPQWAKANLAPDKLEQIRRLLEVEGQFLFRCSSRSLVQLPPEPEGDPAATTPDTSDEGKETPAAAPAPKAPAPAKQKTDAVKKAPAAAKAPVAAAPAEKSSAGQSKQEPEKKKAPATAKAPAPAAPAKKDDGTQSPPAKAATVKPKPKPKVDDAFKTPPADPGADPFASQLVPPAKK